MIQSYKQLIVWQKAIELVKAIYDATKKMPKEELYVLQKMLRVLIRKLSS